jgi:hypothetical protein
MRSDRGGSRDAAGGYGGWLGQDRLPVDQRSTGSRAGGARPAWGFPARLHGRRILTVAKEPGESVSVPLRILGQPDGQRGDDKPQWNKKLEQLRVLESGHPTANDLTEDPTIGVGTPEEAKRSIKDQMTGIKIGSRDRDPDTWRCRLWRAQIFPALRFSTSL